MTRIPLGRLARIRVSNVDKKSVASEVPVRLCNYTDVYYRDEIAPDQEFMRATASPEQVAAFRLRQGDVVITKDSETAEDIGVPTYVRETASDLVCGYHLAIIRPEPKKLDGRFLYWFMSSKTASEQLAVAATGVTRFGLRAESTGAVCVPAWSLTRQRAIADYLDAEIARIGALLAKKQKLTAALLERRKALTYMAVKGDLGGGGVVLKESAIPWLPAIREHWREAPLTLVARLGSGHTPSRERPEWWTDCQIPWITTGEVGQMRTDKIEFITATRESISDLGLANSSAELHPSGTVVLSRTASAGYSAIMGCEMATSQDFVTWTCGPLLEPRFLLLCLRAMRGDLLGRLAQGSTHKTIYMPDIRSIRIPLPPIEEQREIVAQTWKELRRIDGTVERLWEQLELVREHRQALITAAVTGELEVSEVS